MEQKVTIDTILDWYKAAVEGKMPIPPGQWLDAASKLVVLQEDLDEAWIGFKMRLNQTKAGLIEEGRKVAQAEATIQSLPEFGEFLRLEAKRERVQEFVRLAKKRAELKEWES